MANYGSDDMSVLLSYGNGFFADQISYSTSTRPSSVVVGDFNNDTRLDIVVTNAYSNKVSVHLGYSDGSFANPIMYSTGSNPASIAVGDFNNDMKLDIAVALWGGNGVMILFEHPNEVFLPQVMLTTTNGSGPCSFVIEDFNNDDQNGHWGRLCDHSHHWHLSGIWQYLFLN